MSNKNPPAQVQEELSAPSSRIPVESLPNRNFAFGLQAVYNKIMGVVDWFKGVNASNWAIALDIGTEFVKALIYEAKDGKGYVKGVGRRRQHLSHMQGGTVTDIEGVVKNCEDAIEQALKQAQFLPKQTVIGIAGELVKGATTDVFYSRPVAKEKINLDELKKIIKEVQARSFDKARKILASETGLPEIDVRLVNAAIVDVKIDGYKVTNPLGFQGKEVEISVFNAFAPIVHLGALQTIAAELRLDLLSIAAEPYALARSVGDDESMEFSAIFIDVGGGTTDIAVVRAGGVEGTKMFALGGRAFTKRIAQTLGVSFSKAEDLKIAYADGKLPKDENQVVKQALEADTRVWLSGVELTLEEFAGDLLPSRIMLAGGGSNLPEISRALKDHQWPPKLPFARSPRVQFIKPEDLVNIVDETSQLTKPQDITPMALVNLGLDLIGGQTVMAGIMSKVVETLRR